MWGVCVYGCGVMCVREGMECEGVYVKVCVEKEL